MLGRAKIQSDIKIESHSGVSTMKTKFNCLEKIVGFCKDTYKIINSKKTKIIASLVLPFIFTENVNSKLIIGKRSGGIC
jgi:hypothetical protein